MQNRCSLLVACVVFCVFLRPISAQAPGMIPGKGFLVLAKAFMKAQACPKALAAGECVDSDANESKQKQRLTFGLIAYPDPKDPSNCLVEYDDCKSPLYLYERACIKVAKGRKQQSVPAPLGVQLTTCPSEWDPDAFCSGGRCIVPDVPVVPSDCKDENPLTKYANAQSWATTGGAASWHVTTCEDATHMTHHVCLNTQIYSDTVPCLPGSTCSNGICSGIPPPYCFSTNPATPGGTPDPTKPGYAESGTVLGVSVQEKSTCLGAIWHHPVSSVVLPQCTDDEYIEDVDVDCPAGTVCMHTDSGFRYCEKVIKCVPFDDDSSLVELLGPIVDGLQPTAHVFSGCYEACGAEVAQVACKNNWYEWTSTPCPAGTLCDLLRCKSLQDYDSTSCVDDTDPGQNPLIPGQVSIKSKTLNDTTIMEDGCFDPNTISEVRCESEQVDTCFGKFTDAHFTFDKIPCPAAHPYCVKIFNNPGVNDDNAVCAAEKACIDTDADVNQASNKFGVVKLTDKGEGPETADYCVGATLHQFKCATDADGNAVAQAVPTIECPKGCAEGQCQP